MRNLVRALAVLAVSIGILYFMHARGLLDVSDITKAAQLHPDKVALVAAIQFVQMIALLFRYKSLVESLGIRTTYRDCAAATFVSNGVGQWMPGSLAVMEVIRIGLMLGADKHAEKTGRPQLDRSNPPSSAPAAAQGIKARLAVASLYDRLVGFFTMLLMGGVVCLITYFYFLTDLSLSRANVIALLSLGVISLLGAVAIAVLPAVASWDWPFALLEGLESWCLRRAQSAGGPLRLVLKICGRLFQTAHKTLSALTLTQGGWMAFFWPTMLSFLSLMASCFAFRIASAAIGTPIDFKAILAALPIMAIAALIPISFGGMGGAQLVAVAIFNIFQLDATLVSATNLLQNGLLLLVNTLLAALSAQMTAPQIKAILESRRAQKQVSEVSPESP